MMFINHFIFIHHKLIKYLIKNILTNSYYEFIYIYLM